MIRLAELEAWLDDHGLRWEARDAVPVADIDQVAGLTNQARLAPLDATVVERYAADMADGAEFPPVVLTDRLVPVGGNHRIAAAITAKVPTLAAYIVTGLDARAEWLLALEDNRRHGMPLSDDERIHHALRLIDDGMSQAEAARVCGLATHRVSRHVRTAQADQRARRLGITHPGWAALSTTTRAHIGAVTSDKVFARAAELAADGILIASDVPKLVATLNKAETTVDAVQLLGTIEAEMEGRVRRRRGRPPSTANAARRRLVADLEGIMQITPDQVAADTSIPPATVRAQVAAVFRHLSTIVDELEGPR